MKSLKSPETDHFHSRDILVEDADTEKILHVGGVNNHYGGIYVYQDEGKCYWGIDGFNNFYQFSETEDMQWEEIPQSMYNELVKFEKERKRNNQ